MSCSKLIERKQQSHNVFTSLSNIYSNALEQKYEKLSNVKEMYCYIYFLPQNQHLENTPEKGISCSEIQNENMMCFPKFNIKKKWNISREQT